MKKFNGNIPEIQQTCVKAQTENLLKSKEINSKLQSQQRWIDWTFSRTENFTQTAQNASKNFPVRLDTLKG